MNWIHFKLCLIVVAALTPYFGSAEDNVKSHYNDEEEMLPSEQTINPHDASNVDKRSSAQPARRLLRQPLLPNFSGNMGGNSGFQLVRGLFQETPKPAEESSKRLTRNPDVMEDIMGHFQQLGGGMTQQILGSVSQSAPEMSKSFGQALNEALTQTNLLAQVAPGSVDFGEFGKSLSQSFLVGMAPQNLFNANKGQVASAARGGAGAGKETVGAAASADESGSSQEPTVGSTAQQQNVAAPSQTPKNPFEQLLGGPLLSQFPQLSQMNLMQPFGSFGSLPSLGPLMPLGSEISEVRVLPEQYSPYKVSPKQVDHVAIGEMKLKAILKEALTEKTIPILWFHLPDNSELKKTDEDLEIEAKLKIFEQQVIAELNQLQELSKMANEFKRAQLQSGAQPTPSLTTKLNLFEIPVYDITLGDIEKTLKDEHVKMLMQTIVRNNQNEELQRHQQATSKYLTDLTGTPNKRQTTTAEDVLNTMEKEDMLKMMTYAYRMAALHGHEMPWLKTKVTTSDEKDTTKATTTSQQGQGMDASTQMSAERQWLAAKQQQMAMETEKQRQSSVDRQQKMMENQMQQQRAEPTMRQQEMPEQKQMMPSQMQQQTPVQRQMMPPQMMQQSMPMQNQMFDPNMSMQQQEMQRQMAQQQMMANFNWQQQMPMQRQWAEPNMQQMQQQKPEQRQSTESKMTEQSTSSNAKEPTTPSEKNDQQPEQRQQTDTKTLENTNMETNMDSMPATDTDANTNTQMTQNDDQARHKGFGDLFDDMDIFSHGSKKGKGGGTRPTVINYYYNAGGSRYPPVYASAGGYQVTPQSYGHTGGYGNGYANPHPTQYKPPTAPYGGGAYGSNAYHTNAYSANAYGANAYGTNAYGANAYGANAYASHPSGYRTAVGDEEIAVMLQQQQQRMPKMKMMMMLNEEGRPVLPPTTPMNNDQMKAVNPIDNHPKRLAKKQTNPFTIPAAYIVVVRNSRNKSSRSRRKRSPEYTTLEPIDENSLNALRNTYKNSLKEITLNPNETPAEAVMRYNAESVREALEKANKQPMEISAGEEHEQIKDSKLTNVVEEHQDQYSMPQDVSKQLHSRYTPNDNDQFVPAISGGSATPVSNEPYHTVLMQQSSPSLPASFNQQPEAVYQPVTHPEGFYNNVVSKYNSPTVYSTNNKIVAQNPILPMYNSLESAPYAADYSGVNQPPVYQKSDVQHQFSYNDLSSSTLSPLNVMTKNLQHFSTPGGDHTMEYDKSKMLGYGNYVRELPSTKTHYTVSHGHTDAYRSPIVQPPQVELATRYRTTRTDDSSSFDNLMAIVQQQLDQCCTKCKDNILKSLGATLKQQHYSGGDRLKISDINTKPYSNLSNKPHILTYRQPNQEDFEYKQWLAKMSERGYHKGHLTKQHQTEYLKDGKLNLYEETEQNFGHQVGRILKKNGQAFKRETAIPVIDVEVEKEAEVVTAPMERENKIAKLEEQHNQEEEEDEGVEVEVEPEEDEAETEPLKQMANEAKEKNSTAKIKKDTKVEETKNKNDTMANTDTNKTKEIENQSTTKIMEVAETTTHSVYALRGQFRKHNTNPKAFTLNERKQFDNYKNIKKLGSANSISKVVTDAKSSPDKSDKLEKILDILHDLSKQQSKENIKETSVEENTKATTAASHTTTTTSPTTLSTIKSLTTSAVTAKISNTTIVPENSKKLGRRRTRISSKSRKLVKSSPKLETTK